MQSLCHSAFRLGALQDCCQVWGVEACALTELRNLHDSLVVILVMGEKRPFLLRPKGGGPSIDLAPASGDLVVMGGRCQADFEHAVPKSARVGGPRMSASWRWSPGPTPTVHRPGGYFESRRWRTLAR